MAVNADIADWQLSETFEVDLEGDEQSTAEDLAVDTVEAQRSSGFMLAMSIGLVALAAVGALAGWLGYRANESQRAQQQRATFLQVGSQVALNLSTISFTEADQDVAGILDSATGVFHDDFQNRAPEFIRVVHQTQAKSKGTITEAGVEAAEGDHGQVLVAVSVNTTTANEHDPQPRGWRIRIDVQQTDGGAKVSKVEFVA